VRRHESAPFPCKRRCRCGRRASRDRFGHKAVVPPPWGAPYRSRREAIARSGSEAPRQSVAFLNHQSARTHEPLRVVVAILGIAPHPKAQQLDVLMAQLDGEPWRDRWVRGLRAHEHDLF
jgi:hypothetical protein